MASEIKVDTIVNAGGDNDTGIDLATNDQILLKVANATKLTMNSTGQTTIVGEGGTTTTNMQQGLCKAWALMTQSDNSIYDSFNVTSVGDDGTGQVGFNFTNLMSGRNFSAMMNTQVASAGGLDDTGNTSIETDEVTMQARGLDGNNFDANPMAMSLHGDLA